MSGRPLVTIAPTVTLDAAHELPCCACGTDELTVITIVAVVDGQKRPAGGWALCAYCGDTPHPTMTLPEGAGRG